MRDSTAIAPLVKVIDDLKQHVHGRITLASGQGGMVPYYVFQREYGRAQFIDLNGLATDTFAQCPELMDRGKVGYRVHYSEWFAKRGTCSIPRPDVIFDIFPFNQLGTDVNRHYTVVFVQHGGSGSGSSLLPGGPVSAYQFIAVRRDLAPYVASRHTAR